MSLALLHVIVFGLHYAHHMPNDLTGFCLSTRLEAAFSR